MIKKLKENKTRLILSLIIAILGILFIFLAVSTVNAKSTGTQIGNIIGSAVGKAVGSFKAVVNAKDFIKKGEDDGVSAEDTEAEITKRLQVTGKLRILTVKVSLDNLHQVGKDKYKVLYLMEGTVNFTVDLSKVDVEYDEANKLLLVTISEPVANLNINSDTVKKLSDSKEFSLLNKAEKGSKAYINSKKEIESNVKESLENYDSLMRIAKDQAKLEVKELIGSLTFAKEVVVDFAGGEG